MRRVRTLVISGLPESLTEENLYDLFDLYGCIEDVHLRFDEATQEPLGTGVVTFAAEDCARDALEGVHGLELFGTRLVVRPVLEELRDLDEDGEFEFAAEISFPLVSSIQKATMT